MKKLTLIFIFICNLYPSTQYETSKTCKGCHPIIYNEFYNSAHRKASIFTDKIHKAIWDKHPNKTEAKYTCNECHTPTDKRISKALQNNQKAIPINNNIQMKEAISCVYCHSITDVKKHAKSHDKNILTKEPKMIFSADKNNKDKKIIFKQESSFLGMFKKVSGSPYHNIDYTNKNYYTGKMCMGCHAHFENKFGQNICSVEQIGAQNEQQNCITCHMPQVNGSATTIKITKKHAFHGFAGARNKPELLAKYIKIDFEKTNIGFNIKIKNLATHNLFLHPLRLARLNISINNGNRSVALKPVLFQRILGNNKKPSMPWLATEVLKDNMLKANETRTIKYTKNLNSGDIVELEFGYYLVDPKVIKKLSLQDSKEATNFNILKTKNFRVN